MHMLHNRSQATQAQIAPTYGSRLSTRSCLRIVGPTGWNLPTSPAQQWRELAGWRLAHLAPCPEAFAARTDQAVFRHSGELDLNLREYMVVLEKPVGLTLAPDPKTGQVVVQDIKLNSPAFKCGLIQVGDVVKQCSAVFGDDMWPAVDIRRVRWAINSRMGDVKLLLQRGRRPGGGFTAWYCGGKAGVATRERDGMQLPYTFNGAAGPEEAASFLELPGAGRTMQVAFHRNTITQPPPGPRWASTAAAARATALQRLRRELAEARSMPRLDLRYNMHQRAGGSDAFVIPPAATPAAAPPNGGARLGGSGAAPSGPSRTSSSGGGGGGMPPPPPPPEVDVMAPAPPSSAGAEAGNGSGSASNANGAGNGSGGTGRGGGGLFGLKLGGGSSGSGASAAASSAAPPPVDSSTTAASCGAAAARDKKAPHVVTFLPWLLVSCGRLEHRHIALIASSRSLGALLELSLTRAQTPQEASVQSTTTSAVASPGAAPAAAASDSASSTAAGSANSSSSGNANSSSSGSSSSSSRSSSNRSSSSKGGYLVVRGADMVPLASDVGRVSFQALLAAATAASSPSGGSGLSSSATAAALPTPVGEVPPPPPPGSAAATAAMINGADVIAADGSSLVATSLTGASGLGSSNGGGGESSSIGSGGDSASGGGGGANGGGVGSSTMAFLNRSIFLNLRPSMPFASAATKAMNPTAVATSSPSSSASSPSNSSSGPPSASASSRPSFSAQPTSRYDPTRVRHLLNAAASLQRLAFRRGGRLHRARRDVCAVLLHCDEGMEADVAVMLAGWLHWFGKLPLQEAILAAETAMGVAVDQGLLEAGTSALLHGARDRCSRVVLTWKYGGLSAYVAGDVVASWSARVPMVRCRSPLGCKGDTHPGHFFLEVQGLRPGVYYYKYIVDGTWAVDSYSSKVLDSAGNWNNVLVVPEPPVVLTSREGLALARWQAAKLALEAKMGLNGPGRG